jgi:hypothetical protein
MKPDFKCELKTKNLKRNYGACKLSSYWRDLQSLKLQTNVWKDPKDFQILSMWIDTWTSKY